MFRTTPYLTTAFLTPRDDSTILDPGDVLGMRVVAYSCAAAVAFLIYDILLTISDEVRYIWPNPFSHMKVVFFFIRYFPPVLELTAQYYGAPLPFTYSPHLCYVFNVYQSVSTILIIFVVDYILVLCVFAMYPRNRPIRTITILFYIGEIITISVGTGVAIPGVTFDERCVITSAPATLMITSIYPIVYQVYLFGVTVVRFLRSLKDGWGEVPILHLLMRDGTWAFFLLFAILVGPALIYSINVGSYSDFLYGWINTAFSMCGYRILINLNKFNFASRYQVSEVTSPDIVFTSYVGGQSTVSEPERC